MFDLLVMDLDGTLVSLEGGRYIMKYSEIYRDVLSEITGRDFSGYDEWKLYAPISLPYQESLRVLKRWGVENPDAMWSEIARRDYSARRERLGKSIVLYPDAKDFFEHLKGNGTSVCIVSNTPEPIAMMEMRMLGLTRYIEKNDIVCFRYKEPGSKPEPWAIKELQQRHGIPPERTLMVGDSDIDVISGRSAGAATAQLFRDGRHEYHHPGLGPDIECENLMELLEAIE